MSVEFDMDSSEADREDAAVAALVLLHRRQERAAGRKRGSEYEQLVAHFERRGERLSGERLVTQELVQRLLGASSALKATERHRELELHGRPGRVAAGRLRVRNRSSRRATFELTVGDPVPGGRDAELRLDPRRGVLEERESILVRIEASLERFAPGESVTLPIHCRWETGLDRIWLVVCADGGEGR
jgi:hypothetical protein